MNNKLIFGNVRVSFLGGDILRIERSRRGKFSDEDTFFVPDRASLGEGAVPFALEENVLCFGEYELYLPQGKSLSGLRLDKNGKTVYRYRRLKNSGTLPPPEKTPEVFVLSDSPRILLPKGGYSALREGEFRVVGRVEDVYLLFAEKDPKKLRRLYTALTGRCEMVPLSALGGWNSKYYAYNEEEAKELILQYEQNRVPLDVMVIDTDWRKAEDGWGYDVNEKLFPNMKRFFDFAHSRNVRIMFNDHPEPVEHADVFDPREIAYREKNLQRFLEMGLDAWWYDRNWQTHLISPTPDVQCETFGLYLYHSVTENFYRRRFGGGKVFPRPLIMGNVVDIMNGEYLGISDSASHRYAVQWTGDVASDSCALAQEVENLVRCGENCIPYMNSDCGGHTGNPDKVQFIRWMQYGVLSPVFRPHCTKAVERTREPWVYDGETLDIVREYAQLRYRLLPYLYAQAREAYETGVPMFRSLALEYPSDRRAVRKDEYLLGKDLLIAPVCGVAPVLLEEGDYASPIEVTFFRGIEGKGEPIATAVWKKIHMDLRHEPPQKDVPVYRFSARIRTRIKLGSRKRLYIKNDDGATVFLNGKCVLDDRNTHSATLFALADLEADREYDLEIRYFQQEGEAFLGLYAGDVTDESEREVYLPAGKWLDVFDGHIYRGGKTVRRRYGLSSMPLFVRLGALLPLAYPAQTTREQDWGKLVFDFYPDRESVGCGQLYEDDGETTAYKEGAFSKSAYRAEYLPQERAYVLRFGAAEGRFEGERQVLRRETTVKYHLFHGADRVSRVTVNGETVPFSTHARADVFPLNTVDAAPDGETLTLHFCMDVSQNYELKYFLE